MKEAIKAFLEGDKQSIELEFKPINEYAEVLSELGFNTKADGSLNLCNSGGNEWDTNGWQVDFWWTIHMDEKKFMLSGSLFYGQIKLSKE